MIKSGREQKDDEPGAKQDDARINAAHVHATVVARPSFVPANKRESRFIGRFLADVTRESPSSLIRREQLQHTLVLGGREHLSSQSQLLQSTSLDLGIALLLEESQLLLELPMSQAMTASSKKSKLSKCKEGLPLLMVPLPPHRSDPRQRGEPGSDSPLSILAPHRGGARRSRSIYEQARACRIAGALHRRTSPCSKPLPMPDRRRRHFLE